MNKTINMTTIYFYSSKGPHGYLSNFARYPVKIYNKEFKTSEHAYQSQKFVGTEHESEIRNAKTPMEAATKGREAWRPLRKDWESVKDNIMREVVEAKFRQNPDILQHLLDTEDATLVEHTINDSYWADGGDGSGKNMLGIILMEVRSKLSKELRY